VSDIDTGGIVPSPELRKVELRKRARRKKKVCPKEQRIAELKAENQRLREALRALQVRLYTDSREVMIEFIDAVMEGGDNATL